MWAERKLVVGDVDHTSEKFGHIRKRGKIKGEIGGKHAGVLEARMGSGFWNIFLVVVGVVASDQTTLRCVKSPFLTLWDLESSLRL